MTPLSSRHARHIFMGPNDGVWGTKKDILLGLSQYLSVWCMVEMLLRRLREDPVCGVLVLETSWRGRRRRWRREFLFHAVSSLLETKNQYKGFELTLGHTRIHPIKNHLHRTWLQKYEGEHLVTLYLKKGKKIHNTIHKKLLGSIVACIWCSSLPWALFRQTPYLEPSHKT